MRARLVRKKYATTFPQHLAKPDRGTEETVAAADLHAALNASVRHLPAHAQAVFRLSRLEHRTVPEIAAQLRVSSKTVEYHLARSLKLLRGCLREFLLGLVLLAGMQLGG